MKPTILIAAANGFIGQSLVNYLKDRYRIVALVRKSQAPVPNVEYCIWDGRTAGKWTAELEGVLAVINLAGKSVNCRYTAKNKSAIYRSRLESTTVLGQAIASCKNPPKVWLNAASATIYEHSLQQGNTETNGRIGKGFSVDVCQKWEHCFNSFDLPETRQIVLRTSIVLGKNGGVMIPFKRLVRCGAGGKMGNGLQQFSWIHELDVCRAIEWLILNENSSGVYNLAAPNPLTNAEFMSQLRKKMHIPVGIPQPVWLLKAGAFLIGTETELILKSRFVLPERLLNSGFKFSFPAMNGCLDDLI